MILVFKGPDFGSGFYFALRFCRMFTLLSFDTCLDRDKNCFINVKFLFFKGVHRRKIYCQEIHMNTEGILIPEIGITDFH